ncbi:MAG TPA: hypothetical protein VGN01_11235 [Acidobacteriaceae bacterium]
MNEILGAIGFFQAIRNQMRFGEFSRLPIRLQRFAITADTAECDWYMRPPDPWDSSLPQQQREAHLTQQALLDGLKIRELIFRGFPQVQRAELQVFRECEDGVHELMMTGTVLRETEVLPRVASLVMRAKLYGFRFSLDGGVLERMGSSGIHASC